MDIAENVRSVKTRIMAAKKRSGLSHDIKLVAVTKMVDLAATKAVIKAGVDTIAENRLDIAAEKLPHIKDAEKHFIGHLQSNKVKRVVEMFDVIQSIDSVRIAKKTDKAARDLGKIMNIMLQINVSGEEQKFGFAQEYIEDAYKEILTLSNIKIIGMMCMAPFVEPEQTRPIFRKAKEIADDLGFKELSMGMTNDFEVAVEEGSTMVRVGRALFI